jgi:broad specificity phosphatase PhoE
MDNIDTQIAQSALRTFSYETLRRYVHAGARILLLMRHAHRPPLDPSDTTFGQSLPITEEGRTCAVHLGEMMRPMAGQTTVNFFASETLRTVQTAEALMSGMHIQRPIAIEGILGGQSPYFGSLEERMALIAEGRYLARLNAYYQTGRQRGYRPLNEAHGEMLAALARLQKPPAQLTFAFTHDINVATFWAGCGLVSSYEEQTWPFYLDAAVKIDMPEGSRTYGVLRCPRKESLL